MTDAERDALLAMAGEWWEASPDTAHGIAWRTASIELKRKVDSFAVGR